MAANVAIDLFRIQPSPHENTNSSSHNFSSRPVCTLRLHLASALFKPFPARGTTILAHQFCARQVIKEQNVEIFVVKSRRTRLVARVTRKCARTALKVCSPYPIET